jgi:hypothetical protein
MYCTSEIRDGLARSRFARRSKVYAPRLLPAGDYPIPRRGKKKLCVGSGISSRGCVVRAHIISSTPTVESPSSNHLSVATATKYLKRWSEEGTDSGCGGDDVQLAQHATCQADPKKRRAVQPIPVERELGSMAFRRRGNSKRIVAPVGCRSRAHESASRRCGKTPSRRSKVAHLKVMFI